MRPPNGQGPVPPLAKSAALSEGAVLSENTDAVSKRKSAWISRRFDVPLIVPGKIHWRPPMQRQFHHPADLSAVIYPLRVFAGHCASGTALLHCMVEEASAYVQASRPAKSESAEQGGEWNAGFDLVWFGWAGEK
jgi:hypothetical protein